MDPAFVSRSVSSRGTKRLRSPVVTRHVAAAKKPLPSDGFSLPRREVESPFSELKVRQSFRAAPAAAHQRKRHSAADHHQPHHHPQAKQQPLFDESDGESFTDASDVTDAASLLLEYHYSFFDLAFSSSDSDNDAHEDQKHVSPDAEDDADDRSSVASHSTSSSSSSFVPPSFTSLLEVLPHKAADVTVTKPVVLAIPINTAALPAQVLAVSPAAASAFVSRSFPSPSSSAAAGPVLAAIPAGVASASPAVVMATCAPPGHAVTARSALSSSSSSSSGLVVQRDLLSDRAVKRARVIHAEAVPAIICSQAVVAGPVAATAATATATPLCVV